MIDYFWHLGEMATESKRLDLYDGLKEQLGINLAATLMTYLPDIESPDLLTRGEFQTSVGELHTSIGELKSELQEINRRIDRVLLALVAGLFVIVAAVFTSSQLF